MKKLSSWYSIIVFALLFAFSVSPLFFFEKYTEANANSHEVFNAKLIKYNTLEKCLAHIDSINNISNGKTLSDTVSYVESVNNFFKQRFYHGLSNYSISENWIAYVSGKLIWSHLSAIVQPDHILKYSEGLCSQQNIVVTEVLRIKGITSRSVGLGKKTGPGHFLTEVWYNGDWHLYDVDIEPSWQTTNNNHLSLSKLLDNKTIMYEIYDNKLAKNHLDTIIQTIKYGKPNEFPAKKMLVFHQITFVLIYLLPVIFFSLSAFGLFKKFKDKDEQL